MRFTQINKGSPRPRAGSGLVTKIFSMCVVFLVCFGLASGFPLEEEGETDGHNSGDRKTIDRRSYCLGAIAAFSEMVGLGIKKLGFSSTFKQGEVEALLEEAEGIARKYNVRLYRESDLIVTDLFSADIAENREILIIYSGEDIDDYLALKRKKREYVEQGKYDKAARRAIAYELGKLLSYPDAAIERLLAEDKKREP